MTVYNPDLLPNTADPQGSTRYGNVNIIHEQIECHHEETTFYDDICKTNTFIIEEKSPQFEGYESHIFKGTVIKESDGSYHWWRSIDQRGLINNEDTD